MTLIIDFSTFGNGIYLYRLYNDSDLKFLGKISKE